MRVYEVWFCTNCGHIVARDLVQPEAPTRCQRMITRGRKEERRFSDCRGVYVEEVLVDQWRVEWEPGECEEREVRALQYARGEK